jgi:hypothetical protein
VATHNFHAELGCFVVHEFPDYLDVVDDILDAHNPDVVNQIYEVQALEASLTAQDYELLKPIKRNGLLDTPDWKCFCHLAKKDKVEQMVNQAKLKHYWRDPFWRFGFLVPRTNGQAVENDLANGDSKWQDSKAVEMEQLVDTL